MWPGDWLDTMHRCAGMNTPQGINISVCSMKYRSFSVADLRHPEMKEEDVLHSRMTELSGFQKVGFFVGVKVGAMAQSSL